MIVFVPSYDDNTKSNYIIAQKNFDNANQNLSGAFALRASLIDLLSKSSDPLYVMSHGLEDCFQDNADSVAISISDKHLFVSRPVYVFACWTNNALAKELSQESVSYGYTGQIQAPDDNFIEVFAPIFAYIQNNFFSPSSPLEVLEFIGKIESLCQQGRDDVIDMYNRSATISIMEAQICLEHIWSRLRGYYNNSNSNSMPIIHPAADSNDIFP